MPRSFAWGPRTPTGTCAVGLINGRIAVTRLLPQVSHALPLPSFPPPTTLLTPPPPAPRRCVRRHFAQRAPPALRAVRAPFPPVYFCNILRRCLDWNAQLPGVIASGLDKARNDNCIQGGLGWWLGAPRMPALLRG